MLQRILTTPKWLAEKGFFHLLSANFLIQLMSFVFSLTLAKVLTPSELGEVKIFQLYTYFFVILASVGLDTAVLKYCSENNSQEIKQSILRYAFERICIGICFVLVAIVILSYWGLISSSKEMAFWMVIYSLTIPSMVFTNLFFRYLRALKKNHLVAKLQTIIKIETLGAILVSTWIWGFAGFVIASVVSFFVSILPLYKHVGKGFLSSSKFPLPKGFWGVAFFSLLGTSIGVINEYTDVFVLDKLSFDRSAIGHYSLSLTFLLAAIQITSIVQMIVTPYFSEHSFERDWVYHNLYRYQKKMTLLSIFVAPCVFLAAFILVKIIFGPEYLSSLVYLAILLLKYVIWSSYAVVTSAFVGLGMNKYNFYILATTTPIGLLLSYSFYQYLGVVGVAWAQVIASLVTWLTVIIIGKFGLNNHFRYIKVT